MAAVGAAFGILIGLATLVLSVLNIREKLKPAKAHPLEAAVRDIAAAVRERWGVNSHGA